MVGLTPEISHSYCSLGKVNQKNKAYGFWGGGGERMMGLLQWTHWPLSKTTEFPVICRKYVGCLDCSGMRMKNVVQLWDGGILFSVWKVFKSIGSIVYENAFIQKVAPSTSWRNISDTLIYTDDCHSKYSRSKNISRAMACSQWLYKKYFHDLRALVVI